MDVTGEKAESPGLGWRVMQHLKTKLFTGLLVVIPLGLTIFILRFLFDFADGFFAPAMRKGAELILGEGHYFPGLGMVAGIIVLYVAGVVASNILGRRMVTFGEWLLGRIPLVKSIYMSSKQLTEVVSKGGKGNFSRAVYIEFPLAGCYSIAFLTNTTHAPSGQGYHTVYVPTAPNPTSGYVLVLPEEKVYPAPFGVEEAMKLVVSGGMVAPEQMLGGPLC
jgi:uncharacterized membrane protein